VLRREDRQPAGWTRGLGPGVVQCGSANPFLRTVKDALSPQSNFAFWRIDVKMFTFKKPVTAGIKAEQL
jgi:hypothetical protein